MKDLNKIVAEWADEWSVFVTEWWESEKFLIITNKSCVSKYVINYLEDKTGFTWHSADWTPDGCELWFIKN